MPLTLPRNAQIWLPDYLRARARRRARRVEAGTTTHVLFCLADHYEPEHGRASLDRQRERVARWARDYRALASEFRDCDGRPPQHSFFFPAESYRAEHIEKLAGMTEAGLGEVEVHLHHGHDTPDGLRRQLDEFTTTLAERHGLLGRDAAGRPAYGFIHGNWALDNGGLDASTCGVNEELTILRETGCYADFTMPACPDPAQSRIVNALYYVRDDPAAPRSYDSGRHAAVGRTPADDEFLLIEGPLTVWWPWPPTRLVPRIDSGAIDGSPGGCPTLERFRRWVDAGISVDGRPEWVFVKVHTHGAPERNADVLLGDAMHRFHRSVAKDFNDGTRFCLHYVTAREMFNIAKAAEAGMSGNPSAYRDFLIARPSTRG